MIFSSEEVLKLVLAVVFGGLIGAERELHHKSAGFRTIIFICLGSTLFTILSYRMGGSDPVKVAANIVTGIGFLGAGVILRERGKVMGLTTASVIWFAAALGMAVGAGTYILAAVGTLIAMILLTVIAYAEEWVDRSNETRLYTAIMAEEFKEEPRWEAILSSCGVRLLEVNRKKRGGRLVLECRGKGSRRNHEALVAILLKDPNIHNLDY